MKTVADQFIGIPAAAGIERIRRLVSWCASAERIRRPLRQRHSAPRLPPRDAALELGSVSEQTFTGLVDPAKMVKPNVAETI